MAQYLRDIMTQKPLTLQMSDTDHRRGAHHARREHR